MDLLNTLKSAVGGGDNKNDLLSSLIELISGQGGLQGLIKLFNDKGLGDIINSWIGTGENKPISSDQVQSVFGTDALSGLASKVGLNVNDLSAQLSNLLPDVVDKLSPDGKVTQGDLLSQASGLLGGLFGK